MPEKFPPIPPVRTRGASASDAGARFRVDDGRADYVNDRDAAFAFSAISLNTDRATPAAERVGAMALDIFRERTRSMLDDLAEVWWQSEHEGTRVRPFASLPIVDRAELRERVKKLLAARVPEALGDQAVLDAETKRLLDLPANALRRAASQLERLAERDLKWRGVGATVDAVIFAAGHASVAHIGDGRVVRLRRGRLESLTRAHTLANLHADTGQPLPEHLPEDVLTRILGMPGAALDTVTVPVEKGDLFLLMTRSIPEHLDDAAIARALESRGPAAAAWLVDEACGQAMWNLNAVAVEIL